ncbi:hypothetical protein BGW80DRAFT_1447226 [Lactifluus volemus]|nr:hypothetical protein BGW80DRAFT_1447226 [Lactifluus volemus]
MSLTYHFNDHASPLTASLMTGSALARSTIGRFPPKAFRKNIGTVSGERRARKRDILSVRGVFEVAVAVAGREGLWGARLWAMRTRVAPSDTASAIIITSFLTLLRNVIVISTSGMAYGQRSQNLNVASAVWLKCEEIGINGFVLRAHFLSSFEFLFKGSDLLIVEGNLTSTVTRVEDGTWEDNWPSGCRDRVTGFIAAKQFRTSIGGEDLQWADFKFRLQCAKFNSRTKYLLVSTNRVYDLNILPVPAQSQTTQPECIRNESGFNFYRRVQ